MTTTIEAPTTGALTAPEVLERYGVDLTTAEVLRHAIEHVALQMQIRINTGALSPLLSEVNDFGIGLLAPRDLERDLDFDSIAMGTAAPGHYVINQYYARMAIEHWGVDRFEPGDVIVYNDPYRGGSHVNDIGAAMPIFVDDELLGFAVSITHWLDIGGPAPTGFGPGLQHDMYAEGIRLSPRHLYRRGELVRETVELFTDQTRIPDMSINDLQVVHGALELGASMVEGYVRRYGRDAYLGALRYTLDYSERAVRAALRRLPDGDYEASDHMDNNMEGDPMLLHCVVRKRGDDIEVDFSGSSREEWGGYACTWSDTVTGAHLGIHVALPDTISPNAGAYKPVHVVTPPGSCFHALPPASTNAGHTMFAIKAISLVKEAVSKADPDLAVAEHFDDVPLLGLSGVDTRSGVPTPFVYMRIFLGPFGGSARGDGSLYTFADGANCVETSVEFDEETYPLLQLEREFVTDTAGPGEHRGGPATRVLLVPVSDVESFYQMDQCRFPTKGALGGEGGSRAMIGVHRDALERWAAGEDLDAPEIVAGIVDADGNLTDSEDTPGAEFRISKRTAVPFANGDVIVYQLPGAGGYGKVADRDPELVRRDVRNELISPAAALASYGVEVGDRE